MQLSPQLQPWEVSPDSAAASNSAAAAFSGATPRTTVACAAVLFSSRSGYFLLQVGNGRTDGPKINKQTILVLENLIILQMENYYSICFPNYCEEIVATRNEQQTNSKL